MVSTVLVPRTALEVPSTCPIDKYRARKTCLRRKGCQGRNRAFTIIYERNNTKSDKWILNAKMRRKIRRDSHGKHGLWSIFEYTSRPPYEHSVGAQDKSNSYIFIEILILLTKTQGRSRSVAIGSLSLFPQRHAMLLFAHVSLFHHERRFEQGTDRSMVPTDKNKHLYLQMSRYHRNLRTNESSFSIRDLATRLSIHRI